MKRCFIFAAGTFYGLRKRPEAGDLVIAADAGYRVCQQRVLVGSDWYYMNTDGSMATSQWIDGYYVDASGKMK